MQNLGFMLDSLRKKVPEVFFAVVLSSDGLLLASSHGIDRAAADQLAAVASGFNALAGGAARQFAGGAVRKTMVEMENSYLFVTAIGDGSSCLAVSSSTDADIGIVAYEMARLVNRAGGFLTPQMRAEMQASLPR
jgi:predicted regulator of Ras-like GTPase activity (Roadblock/LC7/MglB family)